MQSASELDPVAPVAPLSYIRSVKRVVITVIGFTVLVIGLFGIVLPLVPAVILVPAGLAILATEFVWARRWLKRAKSMFQHQSKKASDGTDHHPQKNGKITEL